MTRRLGFGSFVGRRSEPGSAPQLGLPGTASSRAQRGLLMCDSAKAWRCRSIDQRVMPLNEEGL
jgi:hypothetical protein